MRSIHLRSAEGILFTKAFSEPGLLRHLQKEEEKKEIRQDRGTDRRTEAKHLSSYLISTYKKLSNVSVEAEASSELW